MNKLEQLGKAALLVIVSDENHEHAQHYELLMEIEEQARELGLVVYDKNKEGFDNPNIITGTGREELKRI